MDGGAVVESLYAAEVHSLPSSVLEDWELNVGAIELYFNVECRCLECEGAVDADCFSDGVLVCIDLIEAGGWWNVVIGKVCEEIDMEWKITLNSQPLNGLFVFGDLLRALQKYIQHERRS